jgi:hypothetical protein
MILSKMAQTGTPLTDIRCVTDSRFGRHTECADRDVLVASLWPYRKISVEESKAEILSFLTPEATSTLS